SALRERPPLTGAPVPGRRVRAAAVRGGTVAWGVEARRGAVRGAGGGVGARRGAWRGAGGAGRREAAAAARAAVRAPPPLIGAGAGAPGVPAAPEAGAGGGAGGGGGPGGGPRGGGG